MQYLRIKAKNREEALAKCGLRVGQLARITDLQVHGNTEGEYTIHPTFEVYTQEDLENLFPGEVSKLVKGL